MHIYVINLARSPERRKDMAKKLEGSRFTNEFVNAVEGSTVNRTKYPMSDGLSNGEVGCYLSHVEVWKRLSESDHESALVLEDDVLFKGGIDALCTEFSKLPFEIDLIRMSSLKQAKGKEAWPLGAHRLLIADMHPSGSQGYWLSRTGARKLLLRISEPSQELDKALDRCWQLDMQAFLLDPPTIHEEPSSTTSIPKRSNRKRPGWMARRLEGWQRRLANIRQRKKLQRQLRQAARKPEQVQEHVRSQSPPPS